MVEITLKKICELGLKITNGKDADKPIIKRNLDMMKKWTKEEINELFDEDGNVHKQFQRKSLKPTDTNNRAFILTSTRRHVSRVLVKILNDDHKEGAKKVRVSPKILSMSRELISKDNILAKFAKASVKFE